MKKSILCLVMILRVFSATAQPVKTEMYDLIKQLLPDSTGYENMGDWAVGKPKKFAVKWKADQLEMSPDTSINFFRMGTADITIHGRHLTQAGQPVKWNLILKGPRSGYSSFSIVSSGASELNSKFNIDSLFGNKPFQVKLLKSCDDKQLAGYYYYQLKLPKKDLTFMKISWLSINNATAIRVDCYDDFSKYAVKLACPKN